MAATSIRRLEQTLTRRLRLKNPTFHIEKLPGGKLSGSIVSDTFCGVDDIDRQQRIWKALDEEFGPDSSNVVGTLLAYTETEWDIPLEGDPDNTKRRRKNKQV